jgi:hypothetical protein
MHWAKTRKNRGGWESDMTILDQGDSEVMEPRGAPSHGNMADGVKDI